MHASCGRVEIQMAWGRDSGGRSHEQHGLREPEDPGKALGMPWSEMARNPASVAQLLREWRLKIYGVTPIQNPTEDSMDRCVLNRSVMSYSLWPQDCSLPGTSVHGILQARVLEWVAIFYSRRSAQLRDPQPFQNLLIPRPVLLLWELVGGGAGYEHSHAYYKLWERNLPLTCPKFAFPKGRALSQELPDLANKNTDASLN